MVDEYDTKSNSTVELLPQDEEGIEKTFDPTTDLLCSAWKKVKEQYPTSYRSAFYCNNNDNNVFTNLMTDDTLAKLDFSGSENVTDTSWTFAYNVNIEHFNELFDTSNVRYMSCMFYYCYKLKSVVIDVYSASDMSSMFSSCHELEEVVFKRGTGTLWDAMNMFSHCQKLKKLPLLRGFSGKTTSMFLSCEALEEVPAYDLSGVTTTNSVSAVSGNMFYGCTSLKRIKCFGLTVAVNISYSTQFTREALVEILTNLSNARSGSQTLTMGATNLAKLTEDDIAIATAKGWTLAQGGIIYAYIFQRKDQMFRQS